MLNFMVNAEGGLTTAGYAICIVLGIVVFGIALFFAGKNSEKNKCPRNSLRAVRWQWHLLLLLPISRFSLCHGAAV